METHIYEVVGRMNALRKQSNGLGCGMALLFFVPIPFIFLLSMILPSDDGGASRSLIIAGVFLVYMIIVVIGTTIAGRIQKNNQKELKRLYKETFMKGILEEYFEDVDYRWETGISQYQFFDTGIFEEYKISSYHSEDYLSGVYKGVSFKQVDVEFTRRETTGDHPKDVTVFSGRLFEFDDSFKQVQSVKVVPEIEVRAENRFQIERQDIVKMENMEFNKVFAVASASPQEAFYVLTPQVMERLMDIHNRYKKSELDDGSRNNIEGLYRTIAFHFKQDKLYVVIDHMDSFDSNFLKEVDYPTEKEKIRKHIQVIIDVIEMLKLINA
ncbi:MAG: DUF3137 domain-containing protein [Lachnospira sp.]|nr:DUF3137 domain-containing protein [Lachnospira sp.]